MRSQFFRYGLLRPARQSLIVRREKARAAAIVGQRSYR